MAEMNAVARFFVNAFTGRRNARRLGWIRASVPLPPGLRFLEVGCGNADMAVRLFDGFAPEHYYATDLDPRQLEAARRTLASRYRDHPPTALELRASDMRRLPFPDRSLDVVFSFEAIHHAGEDHHDFAPVTEALSEINRVLRPGGLFVYEDFVHTDRLRSWLSEHSFDLLVRRRGWRHEAVAARKSVVPEAGEPGPAVGPAAATAAPG